MNLFEIGKKNKPQKTIRILLYPNITNFQNKNLINLEKDSGIQVIKKQIKLLNEIRNDLWFYLILPCYVPSLNFKNVTQFFINFETYPPMSRQNFVVQEIKSIANHSLDIDILFGQVPELQHQLMSTIMNITHHTPSTFGWAHFFDLREVVTWSKDSFIQNITGLLEFDKCYLNTEYQKQMVLKQSKETFNDKIIEKLDDILTVQHLGIDVDDIVDNINETPQKIIVFNHRPDTYKHFKQFISLTDKLWETRKDFKVWVPLLDKSNREYVTVDKGDKQWYYSKLKTCCVGFSPKQTYGGWSVATTDGLMNGVPYIMYDDTYYKELNPTADFFSTDDEALILLNSYLDTEVRNNQAKKSLDYLKNNLVYKDKMFEMSDYIDSLLSKQKKMSDSTRFQDILEFIQKNKSVTKKELMEFVGWGRGIKWTPYRRALMKHPNVYDVNDSKPIYLWKD